MPARNFKELQAKMPADARARNEAWAKETLAAMPLEKLRTARQMTQEIIAITLGVKQATVSKLERRADMYVSTLAKVIEAMGGRLEIRASFPDGAVVVDRLGK